MAQTANPVFCESLWKAGCANLEKTLDRQDTALCRRCPDYETARTNLKSLEQDEERPVTLLLRRMEPALSNLRNFTLVLSRGASTAAISTNILWGLLDLFTKITVKSAYAFPRVVDMIEEMSFVLDLFRIYETTIRLEPGQEISALSSMLEFLSFITSAVQFFRYHANRTRNFDEEIGRVWHDLDAAYQTTTEKMRLKVSRLKEISSALQEQTQQLTTSSSNQAVLLQSLGQLDIQPGRDDTSVAETAVNMTPLVNNIPYPRNANFFGREAELDIIRAELDHDTKHPQFRSYAVWGMGGIGKTQLALSYAHERAEKGIPVVIWINSETRIDIYQSYTDVAERLDLQDTKRDASGNQNQFAVTKWLQKTSSEWLLIFDNVEDVNLIRQCWPASTRGSVLITSRSEIVAMDPAAGGLEVPIFSTAEAEDFLYSLLKRGSYSDSERNSCTKLAGRLDGLPLALMLMAMQIRTKKTKIERFLKDYETDYERYHRTPSRGVPNIYYPHSLETAYLTSFKAASEPAQAILGVICLLAPDRIPEELFQPADSSWLTSDLTFCASNSDFDDALEQLLSSSLIGRDPENGTMRVHRIIQERYRTWLGKDRRRQCLLTAAKLLCSAFPKSVNGLAMRNEWHICQKYIPHALALCNRYTEDKVKLATPGEFDDFTALLTSCGWYLMECGAWSQFRILIEVAFEVCENKQSIEYAHLLMSAASVACESGNAAKAYPLIDKAMEIRRALLPPNHEELANLYHNYANIHLTYEVTPNTIKAAKETIYKALEIDLTKPEAARNRILHIRYLVLSLAYTLNGEYTESWAYIDKAQAYAVQTFGEKCHFWASGETKRGAVRYLQGRYNEAKQHYLAAHAVYSNANDIHPSTSSTEVRLGSIALIQGHLDEAHDWFQKALLKCQLNESEKGDRGDTARVMRKLAQALEAKGMKAKAEELAAVAREIRKEVQGERYESLPESDYAYDLMIFVPFR